MKPSTPHRILRIIYSCDLRLLCWTKALTIRPKTLRSMKMDYNYDVPDEAFIMTENVAPPQISPCKVLIKKPFIHYLWVRGGRRAGPVASSSQDSSAEINNHTKCKQFGDKLHQPASLLIHPDNGFKINASSPKRLSQHFIVSHFSAGQFLISLPQSA